MGERAMLLCAPLPFPLSPSPLPSTLALGLVLIIRGPGAVDFVNRVTTNNVAALEVGQVQYSAILNDRGTFVDDCLVYRYADQVMMVVNASNAAKDWAHIMPAASGFECEMTDMSDETALLALQGPMAQQVLQPFTDVDL